METVRIATAASAHPRHRVTQGEAAELVGRLTGEGRKAAAIARGSAIASRATAMPACEIAHLGGIEARNRAYHELAPPLAFEAAKAALAAAPGEVAFLATSSCTGYSIPGWGVGLGGVLGVACDTPRLPITESGCAGGGVAIARATDFLRARPGSRALTVAVELCSLAFHPDTEEGNLTSTLIFGDGAGAAILSTGEGSGLEVIDTMSIVVPGTEDLLGFDLTGRGFFPVLSRELPSVVVPAAAAAANRLLARNGVRRADVADWLVHPGGAAILRQAGEAFGVGHAALAHSWGSLHDHGNTSSAAIYDVLARYLAGTARDGDWAVMMAFGPGVSLELLLGRRRC